MDLLFFFLFLIILLFLWFMRVELKKLQRIVFEIREKMPDKIKEEEEKFAIKKKYYSKIKDDLSLEKGNQVNDYNINEDNKFNEMMRTVTDDKIRKRIIEIYKKK